MCTYAEGEMIHNLLPDDDRRTVLMNIEELTTVCVTHLLLPDIF